MLKKAKGKKGKEGDKPAHRWLPPGYATDPHKTFLLKVISLLIVSRRADFAHILLKGPPWLPIIGCG